VTERVTTVVNLAIFHANALSLDREVAAAAVDSAVAEGVEWSAIIAMRRAICRGSAPVEAGAAVAAADAEAVTAITAANLGICLATAPSRDKVAAVEAVVEIATTAVNRGTFHGIARSLDKGAAADAVAALAFNAIVARVTVTPSANAASENWGIFFPVKCVSKVSNLRTFKVLLKTELRVGVQHNFQFFRCNCLFTLYLSP